MLSGAEARVIRVLSFFFCRRQKPSLAKGETGWNLIYDANKVNKVTGMEEPLLATKVENDANKVLVLTNKTGQKNAVKQVTGYRLQVAGCKKIDLPHINSFGKAQHRHSLYRNVIWVK